MQDIYKDIYVPAKTHEPINRGADAPADTGSRLAHLADPLSAPDAFLMTCVVIDSTPGMTNLSVS